jgi:proline dehydrogenase
MGPARRALLWASQNEPLRRRLPRLPFVRRAVLKFMPGETLDDALEAARRFAERGLPTTLTHLGENVATEAEAGEVTRHYLGVLDRVAELGLDTEISVKLTHLGFDLGRDLAQSNFNRLAQAATDRGNWAWIDMESSPYVEGTVAIYREALNVASDIGLCLQAYLRRTNDDLSGLLPALPLEPSPSSASPPRPPSIRLVKGAYREPKALVLPTRSSVDENFVQLSERMLEERTRGRLRRIAVATHDIDLIDRIGAIARSRGLYEDAFEIQMLYGIRQADQFRFAGSGRPTRSLIAYGPAWYPWYMRRLAEKPSNVWFVFRNLFTRGPLRAPR